MITVKFDEAQLAEAQRMLAGVANGIEKATAAAINTGMAGTKTDAVKLLISNYNFKAPAVRKRINLVKRADLTSPSGVLRFTGREVHLTDMKGTKQDKNGVTINVKKSTGSKTLPGFFIRKARTSGKTIVLGRPINPSTGRRYPRLGPPGSGGGGQEGNKKRATLFVRYAPHPEVVLNSQENWPKVAKSVQQRLDKALVREIDKVLWGFRK